MFIGGMFTIPRHFLVVYGIVLPTLLYFTSTKRHLAESPLVQPLSCFDATQLEGKSLVRQRFISVLGCGSWVPLYMVNAGCFSVLCGCDVVNLNKTRRRALNN